MFLILWALLNLLLLIYFIYLSFQAVKLLKEHKGWLSAILFAIVLGAYLAGIPVAKEVEGKYNIKEKSWVLSPNDSLEGSSRELHEIILEKNVISSYTVFLHSGKAKEQLHYIPADANIVTVGLSMGTSLYPTYVLFRPTEKKNEYQYEIQATLSWSLINIPVYSQHKSWTGTIRLK